MNDNKQTEKAQPPIGLAGLTCFGCLAIAYLATEFFIDALERFGIQWLFYLAIPVLGTFIILYRSSWHRELPRMTRILSMILSACIIFVVVLILSALAIAIASVFFSGGMVSG